MPGEAGKRIFGPLKGKFAWMIVLLLLGIVLLSLGNFLSHRADGEKEIMGNTDEPGEDEIFAEPISESTLTAIEHSLEKRLEENLNQIKGVGKVSVTLILKSGPEYLFASNISTNDREVKETDSGGGERVTLETTGDDQLVLVQAVTAGMQEPVVKKEQKPLIEGVLVVAEGANNPMVKAELSRTVQTLLGIRANAVSVRPMQL